jgi:Zn-finger nucleic acid-binding protein
METKLCPVCQKPMYEKELKGIHIDICDLHGVFLDRGELKHLAEEFKKEGFGKGFAMSLEEEMNDDHHW